jgi:hypothetical protein
MMPPRPGACGRVEDAGARRGAVGTLVSSLVDFASPSGRVDNVTDVDSGAVLGIAVTASDKHRQRQLVLLHRQRQLERPGRGGRHWRAAARRRR